MRLVDSGQDDPFVMFASCSEAGRLPELIDGLRAALVESDALDESEALDILEADSWVEASRNFRKVLIDLCQTNMETSRVFFSAYAEKCRASDPSLFGELDPTLVEEAVGAGIDSDGTKEWFVGHYRGNWRARRSYEADSKIALTPFYCFLFETVWPLESYSDLRVALRDILTTDDPLPLGAIAERLANRGISIALDFLEFFILNDPDLLLVLDTQGRKSADLCGEIFPHFDLAAMGIEESSYISSTGLQYSRLKNPVRFLVQPQRLRTFFEWWDEGRYLDYVDWEEVAVKLRLTRRAKTTFVQGLPGAVHRALVNCLLAEQRVMRADELASALGLDSLALSPRSLPPGRLMAYAPSQRFMDAHTVFYVLAEWVEDERNRKNRIPADRVITPRAWKQIDLEPTAIKGAAERDPTFLHCGVLDAGTLAMSLARQMPSRPIEPYYIDIIDRMLESQISTWLSSVGRGIYVDTRHSEVVTIDASDARKRAVLRRKLVSHPAYASVPAMHDLLAKLH